MPLTPGRLFNIDEVPLSWFHDKTPFIVEKMKSSPLALSTIHSFCLISVWAAHKNTDDLHLQPRQRLSSLVQNITAPYYINLYQHPFIAPPHPHRHHRHYHHHHHHHHHQMCPSKTCLLLSVEDRLWWRRPHLLWKQMTRKSETRLAWPRPSTRTKRPRMAMFVCLFW